MELAPDIFFCLCNPRITVRIYYFVAIIVMVSLHLRIHVAVLCNKMFSLIEESLYKNNKLYKRACFLCCIWI
jgi:hypothetical protein